MMRGAGESAPALSMSRVPGRDGFAHPQSESAALECKDAILRNGRYKMPVFPSIASAAYSFTTSEGLFNKSFEGLSAEEWQRRPNASSNHMLWVAGHVIWARAAVLGMLGQPWTQPWFHLS